MQSDRFLADNVVAVSANAKIAVADDVVAIKAVDVDAINSVNADDDL